jgi:hypothetical protein
LAVLATREEEEEKKRKLVREKRNCVSASMPIDLAQVSAPQITQG